MSEQSMQALKRANEIRLGRVEIKRTIERGERRLVDVLRENDELIQRMPVGELIRSQRRWGKERTRRFLRFLDISPLRPIGALSERQRRLLADELEKYLELGYHGYHRRREGVLA